MNGKRSIAIIGAGAVIHNFYMPALKPLSKSWDIRIFDLDIERARAAAAQIGARAEVWTSVPPDGIHAAIVATPPQSHHAVVMSLLEKGIHVLCEKPLVLQEDLAQELVETAQRREIALVVNQTRRLFPSSQVARKLIQADAIGRVRDVRVREGNRFNWPSRSAFYFDHRVTKNGVIADRGSHVFDLLGWIIGEPLEPTAVITDGRAGPEATACVDFRGSECTGSALMTWLIELPSRISIEGEHGSIVIDDNWNRLRLTQGASSKWVWGPNRTKTFPEFSHRLLREFFRACDGKPSNLDAQSVAPSIRFLEAAYAMARPEWPSELFEEAAA